jgi:spore maturation protein B
MGLGAAKSCRAGGEEGNGERCIASIPDLFIPAVIFIAVLYGGLRGVPVFDVFLEGAAEGMKTAVRILPALVALLTAISMLRVSGAIDLIVYALAP